VADEYHDTVCPEETEADIVTVPLPQRIPSVPTGESGAGLSMTERSLVVSIQPYELVTMAE
jgi:hypothetical protein